MSCPHDHSIGRKLTILRVGPCFRWSLKRVGMTAVAETGVLGLDLFAVLEDSTFEKEE